ncbi:MAG: Jag N-terminal domain-containing protein [Anaerolineales bacterium]|nr:Jag N-terminal domain-containing protein [Anaerolineales bacterium]
MSGTTLEIIAPTVEEALSQGLSQLGLTADAVSVEVLDSGSKGLFGLGGRQVRVRLTVNPPAGSIAPAADKPKPAPAKKAESAPKAPRENKSRPEKKAVQEAKADNGDHDPLLDTTEAIVSKLIHHLGMKAQVSAHFDENNTDDRRTIQVDIRGDDLSALIGRQAETLNAFQYVASLIVGKETQQWVQLVVDVEGFRSRREKQVRQIALRMVDQVIKTGRKATLEPMTASERRAIHIELRGHPAVTTESTGEEPHRKVVIIPKE